MNGQIPTTGTNYQAAGWGPGPTSKPMRVGSDTVFCSKCEVESGQITETLVEHGEQEHAKLPASRQESVDFLD